jgi:RNA polymerase sigma-70 factor (ECF subfamily)
MATSTRRARRDRGDSHVHDDRVVHDDHREASDEELVARFRTGRDPEAFAALVRRYEHELFGYLRRYLGNAELAEDVFQETFLRVHTKCGGFEGNRAFRPWLYAIATNQAIDAQRRARRHRSDGSDARGDVDGRSFVETLPSRERSAEERCEAEEAEQWVRTAVERLSAPQRSVITLVFRRGAKQREIAGILGIPVGTVKSRLHTAMNTLTDAWQRWDRQLPLGEAAST